MRASDVQREIDRMSGRSYEPDDGPLTAQQIEQVKNSAESHAPQEWYIVEKWVAGERRSHTRRGESIDAVYKEEVAAGVDVINVITV